MGGCGSGRSGGRPMVEDGLTLNLNKLIRERTFCPNQERSGSIVWTNSVTGERTAWISCRAALEESTAGCVSPTRARTPGRARRTGRTTGSSSRPRPNSSGAGAGGSSGPSGGDLVAKLHLPPGATTFASRRAYRLAYKSQRESPRDRAINRAFKLRRKLRSDGGIGAHLQAQRHALAHLRA
jgi:hypothetical protein